MPKVTWVFRNYQLTANLILMSAHRYARRIKKFEKSSLMMYRMHYTAVIEYDPCISERIWASFSRKNGKNSGHAPKHVRNGIKNAVGVGKLSAITGKNHFSDSLLPVVHNSSLEAYLASLDKDGLKQAMNAVYKRMMAEV